MPSVPVLPLDTPLSAPPHNGTDRQTPPLFSTPLGLALVEIQGTFQFDEDEDEDENMDGDGGGDGGADRDIGKITFPLYDPARPVDEQDKGWMGKAVLSVGRFQRMVGVVRKLERPVGVVRPAAGAGADGDDDGRVGALEVCALVRYKILFTARPEPVES